MVILGVILLLVAAGCYFAARSQARKLRAISAADTFTARMLGDLYQQVTISLGGEALAQPCEVAGTIEADAPLSAPTSGTACVAFTHLVTREYEADVTTTDAAGVKRTTTERRSETVENRQQRARFFVRDATGRVLIDPEHAELDLADTTDRTDPPPAGAPARTLGYRRQERALPVGTQVYVLGCVVDGGDQPMIARSPRDSKQKFIISRRSERELMTAASSAARTLNYVAAGSGALGLALIVIGLVR